MTRSDREEFIIERDDGAIRWLTINRPEVHNALNAVVLEQIDRAIDGAMGAAHVRVLVITGTGERAFSAGADLNELQRLDSQGAERLLRQGGDVFRRLEALDIPVIAAVNGVALGGGFELALACTFILGNERATFGLPETGLGLIPGYGGTQRLFRYLGASAARRVVLTGERLDAGEGYRLGLLADMPSAAAEFTEVVTSFAAKILSRGPAATSSALRAIQSVNSPGFETALGLERALAAICIDSDEGREGMRAFQERRTPDFIPEQ